MRTFLRTLEPGAATPFWKRIDPLVAAEWGAVLLVSLFYLAFKTYAMWLRAGDEHIYFAMAQAVAHGAIPYRDFFFAHPPVHLLVPALIFRIFGFSYGVAFWIAPLACLAAGFALWRLVRRFTPGWAGVLVMIFFLFGRTVLQSGSHLTGVNMGLMFLCWGAERLSADKPKTGGILLALSVLTGIYFLPATVGVLACYAVFRPKPSLQALAAYLLLGLGVAALFDLLTRGQFFEQVVWYHRAKGPEMGSGWPTFDKTKGAELFHNWPLFLGAIIAGIAGLVGLLVVGDTVRSGRARTGETPRRKSRSSVAAASQVGWSGHLAAALRVAEPPASENAAVEERGGFLGAVERVRRGLVRTCTAAPWAALGVVGAAWVAAHWIFLARLAVVWRYYYAVVFVGASVASGMILVAAWHGLRELPRLVRNKKKGSAWAPVVFAGLILVGFVGFSGHDLALGKKYKIWAEDSPEKQVACEAQSCSRGCTNDGYAAGNCDASKGCVCRYGWQDSPAGWVPGWFNSLMKSMFWGGDTIPDGKRTWSLENTMWHESRGALVEARFLEAARAIDRRACAEDAIFGDSGTAPMLANLTGLRIAGRVFDTNQQRFATGFIDPRETVQDVRADGVRFVVTGNNSWAKDGPIAEFIKSGFQSLWPGQDDPAFGITVSIKNGPSPCE